MPEDRQLLDRTLGEIVARMVRARWPRDTAKRVAQAWGIDKSTADNLIKGHASERTLTKAMRAEGWDLLDALGFALTGQTRDEWVEARLTKIIEEAERAKQTVRSLRAARERLEARASALDAGSRREGLERSWDRHGRSGRGDPAICDQQAGGSQ